MTVPGRFAALIEARERLLSAGRDPFRVVFDDMLSPTEGVIDDTRTVLFGTNNYLGLSQDPECLQAAAEALRLFGSGTTGSRIANGTYGLHGALESELAAFYGRRACMMFTTGYQANLGMLSVLAGKDDTLLIDADCHASIYDGCRLGHAQVIRFRHNDPDDLHRRLRRLDGQPGARLIVVEGLYSMLGDSAPLAEIAAVKRETGAMLLVDEAHSLGVLGETGRGLSEAAGVDEDVDFIVGTFSKSLGSVGGFCVSDHPDMDILRVVCRPYMFSASLPPAIVASVRTALARMQEEPGLRHRLWSNANQLCTGLSRAGFTLGPQVGPIAAIHMPDTATAVTFWNQLMDRGIYVNLVLPPATPDDRPLLRASVTAAHDRHQIEAAIASFTETAVTLGMRLGTAEPALQS
jgi:8-amino-7-oxononanoate synthase